MRLLVLGDSLSDGGWERDPQRLGSAWPASLHRLATGNGSPISVTVRAHGGFRSVEMLAMYRDADLRGFDTLAVLAGANDLWRRWVPWNGQAPVDPDDFARNLTRICELARSRGVGAIWLLTPCLLHADLDHEWNRELSEYREVCVRVARKEGCRSLPTGEEFEEAVRSQPGVKWTYDGVHPRPVGQERLAWTVYHHGMDGNSLDTGTVPPKPTNHRLGNWP